MINDKNDNKVQLIGFYGSDQIHACSAWTSTSRDLNEDKINRIPKLLKMLADAGHHTPFEKSSLHFLVDTDIASHIHLIKHRVGVSVNGESARYKEIKEDKYLIPDDWKGIKRTDDIKFGNSDAFNWADALLQYTELGNKLYHASFKDLEPVLGRKRAKESARYFKTYRVLEAMARPTIGHLDPKFIELMDEIKELLKYAFQTKNEVTFAVSGRGSVGMETCLVNLVEPGSKVLVCINGVFGGRMKSIVERCRAEAVIVNMPWGRAIDPQLFEDTLKKNTGISVCAFVHAETSTGAKSDLKALTEIAHKYNCIVIADTVTSLGGIPVLIDEWNIDAAYSGSQKCLSCPPGLSKVSGVQDLVDVYRRLAGRCDYPLHLGLTEAGMGMKGVVASTAGLAILLQEGIGDTIRVSLTPKPAGDRTEGVQVSQQIL